MRGTWFFLLWGVIGLYLFFGRNSEGIGLEVVIIRVREFIWKVVIVI